MSVDVNTATCSLGSFFDPDSVSAAQADTRIGSIIRIIVLKSIGLRRLEFILLSAGICADQGFVGLSHFCLVDLDFLSVVGDQAVDFTLNVGGLCIDSPGVERI